MKTTTKTATQTRNAKRARLHARACEMLESLEAARGRNDIIVIELLEVAIRQIDEALERL